MQCHDIEYHVRVIRHDAFQRVPILFMSTHCIQLCKLCTPQTHLTEKHATHTIMYTQ